MYKLITILCLSSFFGFETQENTLLENNLHSDQKVCTEEESNFSRILIIPFDTKMYNSSVDREIAQFSRVTYQQIRENMRYGICGHIKQAVGGKVEPVSLMHIDAEGVAGDLGYIYNSIGYKYKALPEEDLVNAKKNEEAANPLNRLKGSFNKLIKKEQNSTEEKEEPGTKVKDGQIHSVVSYGEKFMNTSIHNPNLLSVLAQKYDVELFLFINELDIEESANGAKKGLSAIAYKRKVKVHYTIFDINGKEMYGGAAITYMPSNTNNMNKIINDYFPVLAQNMSSNIPSATELELEKLKKESEQEKLQREEIEKL